MVLEELKQQSIFRMEENLPRIENCLNKLNEEEVWQRPNPSSNSIGNLILHLCGNISQYINASLAGQPDIRERDVEFSTTGGPNKKELFNQFQQTINIAVAVIAETSEKEYLRNRNVQGFDLTGIGIVIHVVEHLSYHVGQIAFWTKVLKNQDLGFYADSDLNIKNQNS